jgi:hypothetical protein
MSSTALNNPKEAAYFYRDKFGLGCFPVKNPEHRSDGNLELEKTEGVKDRKEPAVLPGHPYFERKPTDQEIEQWFAINPNYNLALPMGQVSQAVAFDIDGENAPKVFAAVAPKMSDALKEAIANTMKTRTGSGGEHMIFKVNGGDISDLTKKLLWSDGKEHSEIKLIANKSYVIPAPSRHPNNEKYRWNGKEPQTITRQQLDELVKLISGNKKTIEEQFFSPTTMMMTTVEARTTTAATARAATITSIAQARLMKVFREFYTLGNRQDLWIGVSGLFRRNLIPEQDTIDSCYVICSRLPEDEIEKRIDLIKQTYEKKNVVEVASWKWLEDFIKARNVDMGEEELEKKVEAKKREMLAVLFEFKLEIIKRDNPWALINQNPETYIVARRSDNDFDIAENNTVVKVRRVQLLKVSRSRINVGGNVDNVGRGDIKNLNFDEVLIDAVPAKGMEIIEDPLFGGVKYHIAWEYVDKTTNQVKTSDFDKEPLYTKEELERHLKFETTWVRKAQRIGEILGAVIDAYKNRILCDDDNGESDLVIHKREVGPSGFFWYDGKIWENKLNLDEPGHNWDNIELIKQTAKTAVEAIEELQTKFFNGAEGRDRIRFAHYLKFHLVGPFDYVRKQLNLTARYGWVPRSDMSGLGGTGKTAYGRLGCLMYGLTDEDKYIISKRSFRSEPRLIETLGETTMPLTLEEPDFLANTDKGPIEDMISTLKDSVSKMWGRRLTQDHKYVYEPFLAPILLTHNSAPIIEDGMARRFITDQFENVDVKHDPNNPELEKQVNTYNAHVIDNSKKIKAIGKFNSMYLRTHPDILRDVWDKAGFKVLEVMWQYAGKTAGPPVWLRLTLLDLEAADAGLTSALTSTEVKDYYREQLLTAILAYTNEEFVRHGKSFENDRLTAPSYATFESRLQWVAETNRLPGIFFVRSENTLFFLASLKQVLIRKYGIDTRAFPSLERFASYCGFKHKPRKVNGKATRVAYADFQEFVRQVESASNIEPETAQKTIS